MIKRLIDVVIALTGFLLSLPVFLLICFIVKVGNRKPVFIVEERVGKGFRRMRLYRFNILNKRKENGSLKSGKNEHTWFIIFSHILHFFGLDSLPLIFNVLKGDLSFVGPKPEKPEFVKYYTEEQKQILKVRPGIWNPPDGLEKNSFDVKNGQIAQDEYYRKDILPERLQTDLYYVRQKSLAKDFRVLFNIILVHIKSTINERLKDAKSHNFLMPLDIILVITAYFFSYLLRFEWSVPADGYIIFLTSLPFVLFFRIVTFYYFGIYKNLWKYVGFRELISIISASTVSSILIITAIFLVGIVGHSRSIFLIDWILCISLVGGSRMFIRFFNENVNVEQKPRKNVLIIGAGDVGELLLRMLGTNGRHKFTVVGFIDDDEAKHGKTIHGIKVLGGCENIPELSTIFRIDEVLIAVAQLSAEAMKSIIRYCKAAGVRHRIVSAVNDLLNGSVHLSKFRKVEITDLFGRQPVELDLSAIKASLHGKRILITGAGGSIGSELCRQIADNHPKCIILVDKNENYLHEIRCELDSQFESLQNLPHLCNITNEAKLRTIFEKHHPEIIFHAAAHKHVPLSEENPEEAMWNNVYGTKMLADLSDEFGVKEFLMVSTDKAVNPTSMMGVTKRIAELYIQTRSKRSRTKFVTVRFGNVLNSNGSVIPIFIKQIEKGGPVTITHPKVERYFMSISEAVQLILQAVTMGKNSEIFILDMGKSIPIMEIAIELISQAGYKPFEDIPIKFIGLRPGEKLYEELVGQNEKTIPTSHSDIKVLKSTHSENLEMIEKKLDELINFDFSSNREKLVRMIQGIVPEYAPDNLLFDSQRKVERDHNAEEGIIPLKFFENWQPPN
jgi:FlaA1/EpsC-like NDP-sugar epimerase/lipopolysaccharide/colanic/teichoic acid biosynthesis glycosyltransferase